MTGRNGLRTKHDSLVRTRNERDEMGILDHKRTWQFTLNATPKSCTDAFVLAMTQSKGALSLKKAAWKVRSENIADSAARMVARYEGRAGIGAAVTPLSRQATLTHEAAVGSEISFSVHRKEQNSPTAPTVCSLWVSSHGTRLLVFTADAPIFRSYMLEVERALRKVDVSLRVDKR